MLWNNSTAHYLRPASEKNWEMNNLFNMFFQGQEKDTGKYPPVNIWTDDNSVILMAELPGCDIKDIDVSCIKDQVTISMPPKSENEKESSHHLSHSERYTGGFKRSFELPFKIDEKKTQAVYKNGLLQVIMPKAESAKRKVIEVKG
ncbi:MAG: Hsp20/alpha crystallin family protein [Lentisphaeraceae bacterium]|nr:Hsp20/alpha crystallin family protein [Lentisphaeraceae bacterium]